MAEFSVADRLALIGCSLAVSIVLFGLLMYPAAAAILQASLIAFALVWRFRLHHAYR